MTDLSQVFDEEATATQPAEDATTDATDAQQVTDDAGAPEEVEAATEADAKSPTMVPLAALQELREELRQHKKMTEHLVDQLAQQSKAGDDGDGGDDPQLPDFITDGKHAWDRINQVAAQSARNAELKVYERQARKQYGAEVVDAAYEALKGQSESLKLEISRTDDPWESVVEWHRKQEQMAQIGDVETLKARLRDEIMAELAGKSAAQGKKTITAPASIAGATSIGAASGAGGGLDVESTLKRIFGD